MEKSKVARFHGPWCTTVHSKTTYLQVTKLFKNNTQILTHFHY